jgi:hypothetical protein
MLEQMLQLKRERWASARSHYEKLLERHNAELRIATDGISTFWAVPVREPKTPAPERRRAFHIPNASTNRSRPSDPDPLEEEHKNSTEVLVGLCARRVELSEAISLLARFGTITKAAVHGKRGTEPKRYFALVRFSSHDNALQAVTQKPRFRFEFDWPPSNGHHSLKRSKNLNLDQKLNLNINQNPSPNPNLQKWISIQTM